MTRVGAPGETVSVIAIRADGIIIRPKRGNGPDCDGLFADIEMEESGNFCEGVHLCRFLFEPADQ